MPAALPLALSDAQLAQLLQEDAPYGDLTTRSLQLEGVTAQLEFSAKEAMVVVASEEAARMFELCGAQAQVLAASGTLLEAGQVFLRAQGAAPALLLAWKVSQTLCEYTSGIASAVHRMVTQLRSNGLTTPVACTRKTFPGTRAMAIKSVFSGGGLMHRCGLSDTLLLFPEHLQLSSQGSAEIVAQFHTQHLEKRLVVEVCHMEQALEMAQYGVDVLQLERFSPEQVQQCKAELVSRGLHVRLAVAGGVNASNALAYAQAGADILVSSWPYQAAPKDVKVAFSLAGLTT